MKKDKIKVGLLVKHITDDGPIPQRMVVTCLYPGQANRISCEWITKNGKIRRKNFEPDFLEPYFKTSEL